jgi:hypothetical protein
VTGSSSEAGERSSPGLDISVAHSARVWNYLLRGKDNYASDREIGDVILQMFPDIALLAQLQRRFLGRAVRYLAGEAGIRQFLDIGTGLPTADNTHQVAQEVVPESRIVYVDNDPLVLVHAEALLTSAPEGVTSYIEADVREPREDPARGRPDARLRPAHRADDARDALPAGSYLALSDGTDTSPALNEAIAAYNQNSASSYHLRGPEQIAGFFDGLELVAPGVVTTSRWRPGPQDLGEDPREVDAICAIGRKGG